MTAKTHDTAGFLEARKGKCRRCTADIKGPPNKRYCDICRKIVTKERGK